MINNTLGILICLFMLILSAKTMFAQVPLELKGKVISLDDELPLTNVSITLLNSKDSILINSTRTKEDGTFVIKNISVGSYLLTVSHLQYNVFKSEFTVDENETLSDFDLIKLEKKNNKIDEVKVIARKISAITMKGDTLEFQADSFKVKENARVEDLLRQFPNFKIDKRGNITANGEKVKRVLLEGEEFFGDDPTLVTRNIRADMVDKVQLYDGNSKQTELLGNDFGQKEKTVNVTLKANKNNGYFGKVQVAGGLPKLYDAQAMLNSFNSKRKLAGYGLFSNNGVTGLGWEDRSNFGNSEFGIDELDENGGNFNGKGIPTIKTAGVHYDENFNNKKYHVNVNYKIADLNVDGFENLLSENIQPNNSFTRESKELFNSNKLRNKLDLRIRFAMDSLNTFNLFFEALKNKNNIKSNFYENSTKQDGTKINEGKRDLGMKGEGTDINGFIVWNRKFNTASSVSIRLNTTQSNSNFDRILQANNTFYRSSNLSDSVIIISENRNNMNKFNRYGAKIDYSNRFGDNWSLITEYDLSTQNSNNNTYIFNIEQESSGYKNTMEYKLEQSAHKVRTSLEYTRTNLQMKIAPGIEVNKQIQNDYVNKQALNRQFVNWYPNFETIYTFPRKNRILLSYDGGTVQPVINQIQPILINDDPLNVFVGNPLLKPTFKQSFNLNYRDYVHMENKTILLNGLYTVERNAIVPKVTTDTMGRSVYEYTNLLNFQPKSFVFYLIYAFDFFPLDIKFNSDIGYNLNKTANYVNESLNENTVQRTNISLEATKRDGDKYDLTIMFNVKYNRIESSLDKKLNAKYWTYLVVPEFSFYPTRRLELSTNMTYDYQQPISYLSKKLERCIVNFSIARSFLKNQDLVLKVSANDILNQNKGFSRFVNNNLIVESTFSSIGRNFSLGLTWDINKMGK